MSLGDVTATFEAAMQAAFEPPPGLGSGVLNGWARKFGGFLWRPYSLRGLEAQLGRTFGDATLDDLKHLKCAAAAVVRRHDGDSDALEMFDTRSAAGDCGVAQVLRAAADTPIYFEVGVQYGE